MKADLHIHTCLSPCGDLEMSPRNIVRIAKECGLQVIAITDHNTTRNAAVCMALGEGAGLYVVPGCEVTTEEEVHLLAYFPDLQAVARFQDYLEQRMRAILNDPDRFGYQVAVDAYDIILYEEKRSLFVSIDDTIEGVAETVHRLGGMVVPAHIDRPKNSIISQLGFIPPDLKYDALEISRASVPEEYLKEHRSLRDNSFLRSSDAHYPEDIGTVYTDLEMERPDWECFRKAVRRCKII